MKRRRLKVASPQPLQRRGGSGKSNEQSNYTGNLARGKALCFCDVCGVPMPSGGLSTGPHTADLCTVCGPRVARDPDLRQRLCLSLRECGPLWAIREACKVEKLPVPATYDELHRFIERIAGRDVDHVPIVREPLIVQARVPLPKPARPADLRRFTFGPSPRG